MSNSPLSPHEVKRKSRQIMESANANLPPKSLPPVTPPSGRFLAQLFLVPGTIVFVAVLLLLMFRNLFGSGHTADEFLRLLDSSNPDIRWRGASDLAQVLSKPESLPLQTDTTFAFELSKRIHQALVELDRDEKAIVAGSKDGQVTDGSWIKLRPQRKYIRFLTAAVGRLQTPVAVPVLAELALRESPDLKGNTLMRRQAVWSLALLGDHIKNFKKLPSEHQAAILQTLKQDRADPLEADWARTALHYLDKAQLPSDASGIVKVDEVLARCADADDPYFREHVALALLFWEGDQVEATLLKLAQDDGHGTLLRIEDED